MFVCLFTYFSALYFHKLRRMFNLKAICVYGIYARYVTVMQVLYVYITYIEREIFAHDMYNLLCVEYKMLNLQLVFNANHFD